MANVNGLLGPYISARARSVHGKIMHLSLFSVSNTSTRTWSQARDYLASHNVSTIALVFNGTRLMRS